jgi:hypothetical protein
MPNAYSSVSQSVGRKQFFEFVMSMLLLIITENKHTFRIHLIIKSTFIKIN